MSDTELLVLQRLADGAPFNAPERKRFEEACARAEVCEACLAWNGPRREVVRLPRGNGGAQVCFACYQLLAPAVVISDGFGDGILSNKAGGGAHAWSLKLAGHLFAATDVHQGALSSFGYQTSGKLIGPDGLAWYFTGRGVGNSGSVYCARYKRQRKGAKRADE